MNSFGSTPPPEVNGYAYRQALEAARARLLLAAGESGEFFEALDQLSAEFGQYEAGRAVADWWAQHAADAMRKEVAASC